MEGTLNVDRIRGAIRLFHWVYGDSGFSAPRYLEEERDYKIEIAEEWQQTVTATNLDGAVNSDTPESYAKQVGELLLNRTNLMPWRYRKALGDLSDKENAEKFLKATRDLLFRADSAVPDIDTFNAALASSYQTNLPDTVIKPVSHCLPSMMLWLTYPKIHFYLRPQIYNRAYRAFRGETPPGEGNIMTTAYYASALEFVGALRRSLEELKPRDNIDVQGFLWGICNNSKVWFGGKSYGGSKDMLPGVPRPWSLRGWFRRAA